MLSSEFVRHALPFSNPKYDCDMMEAKCIDPRLIIFGGEAVRRLTNGRASEVVEWSNRLVWNNLSSPLSFFPTTTSCADRNSSSFRHVGRKESYSHTQKANFFYQLESQKTIHRRPIDTSVGEKYQFRLSDSYTNVAACLPAMRPNTIPFRTEVAPV